MMINRHSRCITSQLSSEFFLNTCTCADKNDWSFPSDQKYGANETTPLKADFLSSVTIPKYHYVRSQNISLELTNGSSAVRFCQKSYMPSLVCPVAVNSSPKRSCHRRAAPVCSRLGEILPGVDFCEIPSPVSSLIQVILPSLVKFWFPIPRIRRFLEILSNIIPPWCKIWISWLIGRVAPKKEMPNR